MSRSDNKILPYGFILFLPHWMARVMDREKLSYNTIFNIFEMKKYYSVEDLAILYWINTKNGLFKDSDSVGVMEKYIWTSEEELNFIESNIKPMEPMAMDAIRNRLLVNEMNSEITQSQDYVPFKITNIADKASVFVVIQYPGGKPDHKHMLIRELLKLLYAHVGYDNMASNSLFKSYINRLALINNVL